MSQHCAVRLCVHARTHTHVKCQIQRKVIKVLFGKGLESCRLEQKHAAAKSDVVEEEEMPVQTVHVLGGSKEAWQI